MNLIWEKFQSKNISNNKNVEQSLSFNTPCDQPYQEIWNNEKTILAPRRMPVLLVAVRFL